ncbi:MAG: SDR family oxidoreductase [Gemmatimonadota bacterium]|nr:SDR family oxidoreductase [Gemmatimonadota bacterium]
MRRITDRVVVITGASSGIGRATALAFARIGAGVVLAARGKEGLIEAAGECEALGGRALGVPTDVTVEAEVQSLARMAVEHFGRIDLWVNNASVNAIGMFEEAPPDVFRQVIETNLFGYVHGARAVLPYFREQGAGILVNVSSMAARAPHPYSTAYIASKSAIDGLFEALRMELRLDGARDIHVCNVVPAVIDTPFFQHAANFTGRAVKAMRPVYTPEEVAEAIVGLATAPRRDVIVGNSARAMIAQHTTAPALYERTTPVYVENDMFAGRPAPISLGNVFAPTGPTTVRGGWEGKESGAGLRKAALLAFAATSALACLFTRPEKSSR